MERRTLLTSAAAIAATAAATACTGGTGTATGRGTTTGTATGAATGTGTATTTATGTATRTAATAATPDWTALARGLDGPLVRPGDAAYKTARQLYNTRFDNLKPAAVAYVATEADIKECLAFARRHRSPVAIRNGGHSYAGWSSGTGRLVIDVSKLARIKANGTTATIGAGAKLIDVYQGLARNGRRTIPAGSCPTVGISGLTLGGGHGVASRAYGLTCDSLTSATLITAAGKRLHCTATENADLFWALRGAGNGNFGVVTDLTFRTHPAPAAVTAFLSWPWSKAQAVINAWQEWGPSQPDEIWSSAHLAAGAGGRQPTVSISAFSLGTYTDLQNAVDRLADKIGAPARSVSLRRRTYQESMLIYAGCAGFTDAQCHLPGTTPGRTPQGALGRETYAARSDFFNRSLSPAGIRALLAQAEAFTRIPVDQGGGGGSIALTALGGAVNRVDPLATAFVHRRSRMLAQYIGSWRAGTAGTAQQAWLKNAHGAMRRYASGAAYQNYTDATLTDWRKAYYGPAASRLTNLKKRYDPDRLFNFPQAL
ncbi:FAD-binding oxidoreductase [Streptomyces sp. ISL-98]|uniref:FAD-binding oxidoreductase n=1 Tax=Streptomyces sp. ISL-98 TaxID=2819192 RepID=UPI001BEB88C0|nr:FAD-binding oxidoreductase [Streptomyces sp. ISL-98]MBT2510850.1 FAD-binding oxidoreductase [Streptomyces sp. ISL-98]